ncbi:glycosyltransferase [Microbacterium sp. NPDC056234]|uniref:glycosyltransferase n=1 Tax=Microbacterium sp. NPDC056234 TaxID=3345757 RepID=UPI0035DD38EF
MTPLVSIVIPVFNDAEAIANAIDSCLGQTLRAIEVIVVDDASTDDTVEVVQRYRARDPRVRVIRQERNASAFQARRAGILAARARHLLFLDGDDELTERAAEVALDKATATGADLVQFGIEVVHRDGRSGGAFESRLQPKHSSLSGSDVLLKLFPHDRPAQGQLWRYLFQTRLLLDAYALMPSDLVLPRVNDLPITFLAATLAARFASIPDRLYRYHFGRGGSGQKVHDLDTASFYAGAIRSIDSIESAVRELASRATDSELILTTYASVRRAIIGYTTHYLAEHTRTDLLDEMFVDLYSRASASDIVQSTALHWPKAIDTLAAHGAAIDLPARPTRNVLLATNHLRTGGISGVVISQARVLLDAGFRVTIAAREPGSDLSSVPAGAAFAETSADTLGTSLVEWAGICRRNDIDLVIDHQWQYSTSWHAFALAARAEGIPTIGWSHNFAGRSLLLGLDRLERAPHYFPLLAHLVVLSPLDVEFWKLRGMQRVSYLPNPPSSLLLNAGIASTPKPGPTGRRVELVWWGRLQQRTKRVTELIDVAEHLDRMGVDFRLRIIGPDWRDMSAAQLNSLARERGLGGRVEAIGPLRGADLVAAIDASDIFVNTSIIEGYPLTIPEAQARGLPVAMYDLPWLALANGNGGLAVVPQQEAGRLAALIATVAAAPRRYTQMSAASIAAAQRELNHDFTAMYRQLVTGTLPSERSPEPTLSGVRQVVDLVIELSEQYSATRTSVPALRSTGDEVRGGGTSTEKWRRRIYNRIRPIVRAALDVAPWLRPTVQSVKRRLLRL